MQHCALPENMIPPAWMKLRDEYEAEKKAYHIATRPYHSTGGVKFELKELAGGADLIVRTGQLPRAILVARKGQSIDFFSYAIGEAVDAVGLGSRVATIADTNVSERRETNDEDFAVMGLSANPKGVRIEQDVDEVTITEFNDAELLKLFETAQAYIVDVGSHVVPPEAQSPLVLEDALFQAIGKHTHLVQTWNRRDGDDIALLRNIPEGGAASYLHASGEPSAHNVFSVSPGWVWRREGSRKDTKWGVRATLHEDIWIVVTLPETFASDAADPFATSLKALYLDWQLHAHGNAFYYPSDNA
jgi:hypothetical protein